MIRRGGEGRGGVAKRREEQAILSNVSDEEYVEMCGNVLFSTTHQKGGAGSIAAEGDRVVTLGCCAMDYLF